MHPAAAYDTVIGMPRETLERIAPLLRSQGRLIRLTAPSSVVYVGDTHGDRETTERVFERYPPSKNVVVFLGDAIDRGPDSAGNLTLILRMKLEHPIGVFLLMGNHEARAVWPFTPADFWEGLLPEDEHSIAESLAQLPYAAWHPAGVLALHGALPAVSDLNAIGSIELGSPDWRDITWGDWTEAHRPEAASVHGRPQLTRADFEQRASQLGVRVLVRSHQPSAPSPLYADRCLTIFTSHAYGPGLRTVAILPEGRTVRTGGDLDLVHL